jgi:hypothetical protein
MWFGIVPVRFKGTHLGYVNVQGQVLSDPHLNARNDKVQRAQRQRHVDVHLHERTTGGVGAWVL